MKAQMTPSDERLAGILVQARTIAVVGASLNPARPSHYVGQYLRSAGYRVIPVNPGHEGANLFDEKVVAHVSDIDVKVDILNVFRRTDAIYGAVEEALTALPGLRAVWLQLGLLHAGARSLSEQKGVRFVENRCIMVEHRQLLGSDRSR